MDTTLGSLYEEPTFHADDLTHECFGGGVICISLSQLSISSSDTENEIYDVGQCPCLDICTMQSPYCHWVGEISSIVCDSTLIENIHEDRLSCIHKCSTMIDFRDIQSCNSSATRDQPGHTQLDAICDWFLNALSQQDKDVSAKHTAPPSISECLQSPTAVLCNLPVANSDVADTEIFYHKKAVGRKNTNALSAHSEKRSHSLKRIWRNKLTKLKTLFQNKH